TYPKVINLSLHPNPFNAVLNVRIREIQTGECRVRLMDIAGRMVSDRSISFRQQDEVSFVIDTAELPTGIYIVSVLYRTSSGKSQSALAKALLLR
ncbi:MAG: T9SS type A sorting domain-containing protein, partial [Calditrichaeota bacterium]|nr:T9SS type A sorting domain-containing protein [Calditrichota bacterium]